MNEEVKPICRVVKYELLKGTFYHPERYILKTHWFSEDEWVWEKFAIYKNPYEFSYLGSLTNFTDHLFKDPKLAERHCKEYMRIFSPDKPIKVWYTDPETP